MVTFDRRQIDGGGGCGNGKVCKRDLRNVDEEESAMKKRLKEFVRRDDGGCGDDVLCKRSLTNVDDKNTLKKRVEESKDATMNEQKRQYFEIKSESSLA